MKKFLLSLMAVFAVTAAFAQHNPGDYIYNAAGRYKIVSENKISNPQESSTDQWTVSDVGLLEEEGYQGVTFTDQTSSTKINASVDITMGRAYVLTFKVRGGAAFTSSTATGSANYVDAFASQEAADEKVGTAGEDYVQVAAAQSISTEWTDVTWFFVNEDQSVLNIIIQNLYASSSVANFGLYEAMEVYDIRIAQREVDFAKKLIADPFLSSDANATAEFQDIVDVIEEMLPTEMCDDKDATESMMESFLGAKENYLSATLNDIKDQFANIGITGVAKYNRGTISNEQVINNFKFRGDNWLHADGAAELAKQIQGSYANNAGSLSLYKENPVKGKYYISGKIRNSTCDKNYALGFGLEKECKIYINGDTISLGLIGGEDWQQFYMIADVDPADPNFENIFDAGFWWEGHTSGSRFEVKELDVRAKTDEDAEREAHRKDLFKAFKTQFDAAKGAYNNLVSMLGNANYPWKQEVLSEAKATWEPKYLAAAAWITEDGEDTRVASMEELAGWPKRQGFSEADSTAMADAGEWTDYPVVRGLQGANNEVIAENQPVFDLKATVAQAKALLVDPRYSKVDPSELEAAVAEAEALIAGITSESQKDDFEAMIESLKEAIFNFESNGVGLYTPVEVEIVDGDFKQKSGNIAGGTTTYWNNGASEENPIGWVSYTTDAKAYFRVGAETHFTDGARAGMWRGYTGNPTGSLTQEITVTKPGFYTLRCEAYAASDDTRGITFREIKIYTETEEVWDEELEEYVEIEKEIGRDTLYHTGVFTFFGPSYDEKIDSAFVQTQNHFDGRGESVQFIYEPVKCTLGYNKTTEGEETLKFGIDGLTVYGINRETGDKCTYGPNAYGIGSVHLHYYGVLTEEEQEQAKTGIEKAPSATSTFVSPIAKGVYNLTGVKIANSLSNDLPKGIYIVNGKKYLVK